MASAPNLLKRVTRVENTESIPRYLPKVGGQNVRDHAVAATMELILYCVVLSLLDSQPTTLTAHIHPVFVTRISVKSTGSSTGSPLPNE